MTRPSSPHRPSVGLKGLPPLSSTDRKMNEPAEEQQDEGRSAAGLPTGLRPTEALSPAGLSDAELELERAQDYVDAVGRANTMAARAETAEARVAGLEKALRRTEPIVAAELKTMLGSYTNKGDIEEIEERWAYAHAVELRDALADIRAALSAAPDPSTNPPETNTSAERVNAEGERRTLVGRCSACPDAACVSEGRCLHRGEGYGPPVADPPPWGMQG